MATPPNLPANYQQGQTLPHGNLNDLVTGVNSNASAIATLQTSVATNTASITVLSPQFYVDSYFQAGDFDDTAAIARCYAVAGPSRGMVKFGPRAYLVTPDANGYAIYGDLYDYVSFCGTPGGRLYGTLIEVNPSASTTYTGIMSLGAFANANRVGLSVRDLTIRGHQFLAYGVGTGIGIDMRGPATLLEHVRVEWTNGTSIKVQSANTTEVEDILFHDVYCWQPANDTADGLFIGDYVGNSEFTEVKCNMAKRDNQSARGGQFGIHVLGTHSAELHFDKCHPYFAQKSGGYFDSCQDLTITGGKWEHNGSGSSDAGIRLNGVSRGQIVAPNLYENFGVGMFIGQSGASSSNISVSGVDDYVTASSGPTQTRNIFVTVSSDITIANSANLQGSLSASIELASSTKCVVTGSHYDKSIIESGSADQNVITGNIGPSTSITVIGAHSHAINNLQGTVFA